MTEKEIFEKSFQRPSDFFRLTEQHQWSIDTIDSRLGILDWKGDDLSKEDMARYKKHYR